MFNIPMYVRRIIAMVYLLFAALYLADKFTAFSFFNISQAFPWRLIIIPTLMVVVFMPTPDMIRDYNRERAKKTSGSNNSTTDDTPQKDQLK